MRLSSTASSQHTRYLIGRLWRASALVVALSVVTANPLKAERKPYTERHSGTVISIGKRSFVLGERSGLEKEIHVSGATIFYRNRLRSAFSQMRVGNSADVTTQMRESNLWARRVLLKTRVPLSRASSTVKDQSASAALTLVLQSLTHRFYITTEPSTAHALLPPLHQANASTVPSPVDCSHFVHDAYQSVGLNYPYSSSRELYQGVLPFTQTATPQQGDVLVWRGHVGIVIDPVRRTFLSALRGGLRVSRWCSSYWRRHGAPVFYQYDNSVDDGGFVLTDSMPASGKQSDTAGQE